MRINVTKLELVMEYFEADRDRKEPSRRALTIKIRSEDMESQISPMLHSDRAIATFQEHCNGLVPWYDKASFNDLRYQIEAFADAMRIWESTSGGRATIHHFTFPMKIVADTIGKLQVGPLRQAASYAFTDEELAALRKSFWPNAQLVFTSDEARDRYMQCLWMEPDKFSPANKRQLTEITRNLMRIARNNSDGNCATVYISTDPYPNSFYFSISSSTGVRVMNGGIICHPNRNDDGEIVDYEYSVHT